MNKKNKLFLIALIIEVIIILVLWIITNETDYNTENIIKQYVLVLIFQLTPILSYIIMKLNEQSNDNLNKYSFIKTKQIILSWQFIILNILSFIGINHFSSFYENIFIGFIIFFTNNCILTLLFVMLKFIGRNAKYKNDRMLLAGFSLFIFANVLISLTEKTAYLVTSFFPIISINLILKKFSLLSIVLFTLYVVIIIISHLKLSKDKKSLLN